MNANDGTVPLETLTRDYIRSPLLEPIVRLLPLLVLASKLELPQAQTVLASIAARSPHRAVRASALFCLARTLIELKNFHDALPHWQRQLEEMKGQPKTSPEDIKEMETSVAMAARAPRIPDSKILTLLSQVKQRYADTEYAKKAERAQFELEHLQIGKVAPDFAATDEAGKRFKLSDYRGKVVVLDFWGFW